MTNPYEVLGLPQNATVEQVTKQYKKLAKKYHPDLHPDKPEYAEKMREINEAYDAIKQQNTYTVGDQSTYNENSGMGPLDTVESYLRGGMYAQGLYILNGINEKSARWYYLAAIANSQSGNGIIGMQYAETAVQMEPSNREYHALLDRMKAGELAYFSNRTIFSPLRGYPKFVVGAILALLCIKFCVR